MSETVPGHAELVEEGLGILTNLMDNIQRKGNYSAESTVFFLDQIGQCLRAALSTPGAVTEADGYIIANGDGTKWRTLDQGLPAWTDDREKAIRYARRADAELAAKEDEDAWLIQSYAALRPDEAADEHACPICAGAFKADDTCATDIELGTCHASCLKGSPTVDLDSGEPVDGPIPTYPYSGDAVASCTDHSGGIVTNSSAGHESEASPRISAPDEPYKGDTEEDGQNRFGLSLDEIRRIVVDTESESETVWTDRVASRLHARVLSAFASLPQSQDIRVLVEELRGMAQRIDNDGTASQIVSAEELRDAADALSCLAGEGWRDIESDPPPHDVQVLLWSPPSMGWPAGKIEARPFSTGRSGDGWSEYSQHSWATKWCPLPAAPSVEEKLP